MKRITSFILVFCLIVTMITGVTVTVGAVSINDSSVFIKQANSSWCTWASVAMMMRRQAILDGNPYWDSITDSTIHYSGGLRNDFNSCGYRILGKHFANCTSDNKSYLISMLKSHPEGVVCYMYSDDGSLKTHAVLITDYNASEDMFYCADSANGYWGKRMKITEAYLTGGTSNQIVKNFKKIWYISSGTCNLTSPLGTTSSTTYYVTNLVGNGGNPSSNSVKSASGSTISLPKPTAPEGYVFNGWFTAASGGTFVTGGSYTVSCNSTLYAQWRPITYDISYDANGGSGAPGYQIKTYGKTLTLSYNIPTREGYSFLGWAPSPSATVASYQPGDSFLNNADTTLWAVWKALPPSISVSESIICLNYDTNKSETITFTISGQLPSSCHLNANHSTTISTSWGAWVGKQCSLTITATEEAVTNNNLVVTLRDKNENVYATITVYVYCAGKYCTVNFDANGGTNAPESQKVPYNHVGPESRLTDKKPTRSGYTFLGWSTNSTDVIPEYCYLEEDTIVLTDDVTLYAIWHETEFSVVVNRDLNGGTGSHESITLDIDLNDYSIDSYNWTAPRISITGTDCGVYVDNTEDIFPTKEGYLFAGWKGTKKGISRYFWPNGIPVYNKNLLYIGFDYDDEINLTAEWIKEKWNGDVAEDFADGLGTKEEPYIIKSISELAKLSYDVAAGNTYENTYFELLNDIDMEFNSTWLPIGYNPNAVFKGNFNGNNFKIYNFSVNSSEKDYSYLGLFGYCVDAVIENIIFENADIEMCYNTSSYVGTVIGRAKNCIIRNINTINSKLYFDTEFGSIRIGDIVGSISNGTLVNGCYSENLNIYGTSKGNIYAGGIAGEMYDSDITNSCVEQSNIRTTGSNMTHWIGGICGFVNAGSNVEDCASITGCFYGYNDSSYTYVGGIVGSNAGDVFECIMNNGTLESVGAFGSYVGGIVGVNNGDGYVMRCISASGNLYSETTSTITSMIEQYECVGAIIGKLEGGNYANNYYSNTINFEHGANQNSIGTSKALSTLKTIDFQRNLFTSFKSFYEYENSYGHLWKLTEGNLPEMYKASDFMTIITNQTSNGTVSTDVSRALNGTEVNIIATPDSGYHLDKIYVNDILQDDISTFTVMGNSIITPVFELDEEPLFTVYAKKCDNGVIILDKDNAYSGEIVTVTVVPEENYVLDVILVDGVEINGNTFSVTSNHIVTAIFAEKTYTMTVNSSDQGTISLDKTHATFGELVTVSVVPNSGYRLENILVDGEEIIGNSFVVSRSHTVSCEWIAKDVMYTIDIEETENGRIEIDDTISREGSIITIYAIPNNGYELNSIIVNGKSISDNSFVLLQNSVVTATFTSVDEDIPLTGISLDKISATLNVGETVSLNTSITPDDATNKNVTWTSSDTSVATVSNGVVTAKSAGTATITVTTADGNKTATCTVTVNPDPDAPVITMENKKGRAGDTVDVMVSVNNNPGIISMLLELSYDNDYLTLTGVEDCGILGTTVHGNNITYMPYVLCWANDTAHENITANGNIVKLSFKVKDDAPEGVYNINLSYDNEEEHILNFDFETVDFDVLNGSIEVIKYVIGDVTGDGKVTSTDRITLSRYLAKWEGYDESKIVRAAADVTGDGKVTSTDRITLSRYLAKWEGYETLPVKTK